ncbi:hypothetical protein Rsub_08528 [Raphidocelis subcapitata]|uniref:SDR family oxidoreductase n=1 Tax=Raphidocelis subcapitata TaxID=307507 RepID=A0A2V0PEE9_9CHLO|nr:hypothetical protein Rsub_08528 [Raphidocelis subcapitata]|eukprot:GBF95547.1 hypothetical protein Rsub_08528 [Raphidocelis subcapitata]
MATVALVTGAASGIGRAAALAFAAAPPERVPRPLAVVVADIDVAGGEETCRLIEERGASALFVRTDVTEEAAVSALAEAVRSRYGALHFAAINAGVEGARAATHDYPTAAFDSVVAVNLRGSWLCLKHLLPLLLAAREAGRDPAVVVTSSTAGLSGMPEFAPYCATKHALIGLVRSAAREYAGRAATNAGYPIGRIATAGEVAEAVVWLAAGATFSTGTALVLDGGAGA